jgi:hypothetical protein
VCDEISDPFILGLIVPKIYLPSGMDEQTRGYVLAHERAHLKRYDFIWKPLGFLLLSATGSTRFCGLPISCFAATSSLPVTKRL